jgi:hypothetical protein
MAFAVGEVKADFVVNVVYADELRPSPSFPDSRAGDSSVRLFAGGASGGPMVYVAGAMQSVNTGATAINISTMTVDGFGVGSSHSIWRRILGAGYLLNPGKSAIFTQTSSYNFDNCDTQGAGPAGAIPHIKVTIDGVLYDLSDTAQVLIAEGTDHQAQAVLNWLHQWRPIGTLDGQGDVPESSTFVIANVAGLGLLGRSRIKHKAVAA